jgi:predicted DNA binding CopG/RHH family protein
MKQLNYSPAYVHSSLEGGQIKMCVCISNSNEDDENIEAANQFCQDWVDQKHETSINLQFDFKQIIDDALMSDRSRKAMFKFKTKDDLRYLRRIQSDLMKALSRVNTAIAGVKYVRVDDKGNVQD